MILLDAIEGKRTERVPVAPLITAGYASRIYGIKHYEYVMDSKKYADAQIHCKKVHGYDWVWAHQLFQGITKWERDNAVPRGNGMLIKLELGTEVMVPDKGSAQPVKPAITSKEQLSSLRIPDAHSNERTAPIKYLLEKEDFVCGTVRGPFTMASSFFYGLESMLVDLKIDPDFAFKLLDFSLNYCLETAKAIIEAGAHAIYVPDSSASSSVLSPDDYRKFALPYEKTLIKEIRKKVPVILHICGDIHPILDDIVTTGASCLSFDELTDANAVHKKITAWGNVPVSLLVRGTPQEVRLACDKIIKLKERAVLSSGCVVPGNAKEENVKEMVRASIESSG